MPKESETQARIFFFFSVMRGKYPGLDLMYHVPNGGSRNKIEAANLKRQGVKAGVPDICLPVPRGGYHGLYIELKEGRNKATEKQLEWIAELARQGYVAVVCTGFDAAVQEIVRYLEGKDV